MTCLISVIHCILTVQSPVFVQLLCTCCSNVSCSDRLDGWSDKNTHIGGRKGGCSGGGAI